jgi:transcriptional regulator with XRE-family HTH domain
MARNRKPSRLRTARERLGLSMEKTAVQAGISVAWLRQVERDPDLLTPRVAQRLLPVLGLAFPEAQP